MSHSRFYSVLKLTDKIAMLSSLRQNLSSGRIRSAPIFLIAKRLAEQFPSIKYEVLLIVTIFCKNRYFLSLAALFCTDKK